MNDCFPPSMVGWAHYLWMQSVQFSRSIHPNGSWSLRTLSGGIPAAMLSLTSRSPWRFRRMFAAFLYIVMGSLKHSNHTDCLMSSGKPSLYLRKISWSSSSVGRPHSGSLMYRSILSLSGGMQRGSRYPLPGTLYGFSPSPNSASEISSSRSPSRRNDGALCQERLPRSGTPISPSSSSFSSSSPSLSLSPPSLPVLPTAAAPLVRHVAAPDAGAAPR